MCCASRTKEFNEGENCFSIQFLNFVRIKKKRDQHFCINLLGSLSRSKAYFEDWYVGLMKFR